MACMRTSVGTLIETLAGTLIESLIGTLIGTRERTLIKPYAEAWKERQSTSLACVTPQNHRRFKLVTLEAL